MGPASEPTDESTYPLRAAARLTGLSPEVLRAWERRHRAVVPLRTPGGTRRYRSSDLERLRLLKAAVDAGHRIGEVAGLDRAELEQRGARARPTDRVGLDEVLAAIERLDAEEVQHRLATQLAALGPTRFAREFARPLLREIGDRWANDRLCVASEHLASGVLRSLLGAALTPSAVARAGPRIVFATPSGERHELGLQIAALTAMDAGALPVYLGPDLPVEEMLWAVGSCNAAVLALSFASPPPDRGRTLRALRSGLPTKVRLWVGGSGAAALGTIDRVEHLDLDQLEQHVGLLQY